MAAKEPGKDSGGAPSSSLRDALRGKLGDPQGGVGAPGSGAAPGSPAGPRSGVGALATPADDNPLSQPITFGQPNNLQRAVFCRQFATLIEVGIPVLKAMQMLSVRTSHRKLREAVRATARGVEEGQAIHQAMAPYARTYSPLVVNIIKIGETGGILEGSLVRLAAIMEAKARIKSKIISASMYPIAVLCVAVLVVMAIMVKAIPTFASVYQGMGKDLPATTNFVIHLSHFLEHTWLLIIILGVGAIVGLSAWGKTPSGRRVYSILALRVPILRGINQKIAVARSTRTLAGLVAAGIPLIESLSIAADTNENALVSDALHTVHDQVERGERMALTLAKANIFPTMVVDMISIGEETGTLDRMLDRIADIYDVEVDTTLNGLSSIIEPLLIIVLGGLVMFIALAVLTPYFNLAKNVGD